MMTQWLQVSEMKTKFSFSYIHFKRTFCENFYCFLKVMSVSLQVPYLTTLIGIPEKHGSFLHQKGTFEPVEI